MASQASGKFSRLLLVLALAQGAALAEPLSLPDAVALTIRENRTIKNAYLDRLVQKYDLRVAQDKFSPKLNLSASLYRSGALGDAAVVNQTKQAAGVVTQQLSSGAQVAVGRDFDLRDQTMAEATRSRGWSLNFSQPLLKGAGTDVNTASVQIALLTEQSNILSLKSTLINVLNTVITAYRSYVQAIQTLEITRQSLVRSQALAETNRELIAAGRMAAIELVQSESEVANREFSLSMAENTADAARLALTKSIDIDRNTVITPMLETEVPALPYTREQARTLAFANRPDVQGMRLSQESARLQHLLAKNGTLWSLALNGSYGQRAGDAPGTAASNWSTALVLNIPLADLAIQQSYMAAEIQLQKLDNDLTRQRESIEIDVDNALRNAEMSLRQIKLATQARVLSEKKVEIETDRLKAGRSTNFQMVSYQNDLVYAQNNELSAIINYRNALTTLDSTLGITLDQWGVSLEQRQ
jgi:outer membrane protein TolC